MSPGKRLTGQGGWGGVSQQSTAEGGATEWLGGATSAPLLHSSYMCQWLLPEVRVLTQITVGLGAGMPVLGVGTGPRGCSTS